MSKISSIYVTHNVKRVINNPLDKFRKNKISQNSPYRSQSNKFKNTMSNIKRQLSNISLGEKIIYTSKTKKEENNEDNEFMNNLIFFNYKKKHKICHIESFNIINNNKSKYVNKNIELQKENKKLKENIKFLLNENKKKESKENNIENKILKQVINEYERKLKTVEEKYTIIIQENLKLKKQFNDMFLKYSSISRNNIVQDNKTTLSPQINNSIFSLSDDTTKENNSKFNNDFPDTNISLMHKSCSSVYIKKIPKLLKSNSTIELINEQNKSFNSLVSFTRNSVKKIDSKIIKFTNKKTNNNFPILSFSPPILYNIFHNNFTKEIHNKNIIITFNINTKKFSKKNYIEGTSNFNEIYNNSDNHENDLILSLSNGVIIITGEETNQMFFYNNLNNYIYNLQNLNYNHNKGGLIQYDNNKLICISGMKSSSVELYNIKDNQWSELSKMNRVHCESAYIIINNNILYSFFGFDYENNCYIEDIEYLNLNNSLSKWEILKTNLKINIKGHSVFNLYNENSENLKLFLIGGHNNIRSNKGLIEIELNNFEAKILDGFFKNDEKYNNKNNKSEDYIFSTTFFINYDNETNKNYIYNIDKNLNVHIIDIDTLKHNVYKCHIFT